MKKIIVVCCLLLSFILGACCLETVSAEQDVSSQSWEWHSIGGYYTFWFVDNETGVEYIIVATGFNGNNRSIAITPRYDADGTLYTE